MSWDAFHPAVANWFAGTFTAPTRAQLAAWRALRSGRHTLVAAPTGSGKTLAAFLTAIDQLVQEGVTGKLGDETRVLYVSPLKALSNDIQLNLERPLAGIRAELERLGLPTVALRSMVRTGDTPPGERLSMRRQPPHLLVTTPESLYILLGSASGRAMLASLRCVIVDEIHALVANKRGSHLALSLERLQALCARPLQRIGLSATQQPIDEVARYLVGAANVAADGQPDCAIIDVGHARPRDLALELPNAPLAPVMSNEVWEQVYDRLAELGRAHRTTLVFVNTRRMAERAARHLSDRLGKPAVAAHHGSLARELRLDAEQRLKRGELRMLVATASLELGIDIGEVELVCQLGSPRAIAAFLQRVGRSGHALDGTPKGRLFPLSRDDLVESAALLDAVRRGELDQLAIDPNPLDVLAQQIVAEVACAEWPEAALYDCLRHAWPYHTLSRERYAAIVRMLAEGYSTRRGPRAAYLHRDAVNGVLRARRGARLTALTSGGAIPDTADYQVVLEPQAQVVGSVHEDFAVESLAGDVFQLGNVSYRVLRVEQGRIRVEDAQGAPPSVPFWLGEAPGRSDTLSYAVARLREEFAERLVRVAADHVGAAVASASPAASRSEPLIWLTDELGIGAAAAQQLHDYLAAAHAALGLLPSQRMLAMERFFDESGGTQLVIHSPFGNGINRAWGLALRKRFCRKFNFELQAAASEDAIVLSLATSHSFPLLDVARYLHSNTVEEVLIQALLDAPMFGVRWRWNATTALALPRFAGGRKVAPQLQRMRAEDLLATVFPDQVACLENIVGERQIPDHPLVQQTLHDCLFEAMDIDGLKRVLHGLESGTIGIQALDLTSPSPLAAEILNARPYAFLDDAPLEERRTQAVLNRRWADPQDGRDFARLDPDAIAAVRDEAWPQVRDVDEMHEALLGLGGITASEIAQFSGGASWLLELAAAGRATRLALPDDTRIWTATERLPQWQAVHPDLAFEPTVQVPAEYSAASWSAETALVDLLRARLTGLGPTTAARLGTAFAVAPSAIEASLLALEQEGYVMRGRFGGDDTAEEWCERHLLARIHRYTVGRLRREIEPVEPRDYLRFALQWQHLTAETRLSGPDALSAVLTQLEGYEAAAAAWESELLPARIDGYDIGWLDELCLAGRVVWSRLRAATTIRDHAAGPVRATPIVMLPRRHLAHWNALAGHPETGTATPSSRAARVLDALQREGASFFDELLDSTRLLRAELEDALAELVATGLVVCDSFAGLRALLLPAAKRAQSSARRGRRIALWSGLETAGRWSLQRRSADAAAPAPQRKPTLAPETLEHVARTLLRRYGVVAWRLLGREAQWLPPWRDLLRVYQRLEARGEIRGGRFIAGVSGEQFALPEAIAALRKVRTTPADGSEVCVSAADPLNLVGVLIAGDRVPALNGNRVLYRDGVPIASWSGGELHAFAELTDAERWRIRELLQRAPHHTRRIPDQRPA